MINVDLSKYNNDWFKPGNKLLIFIWMLTSALIFRTTLPIPSVIKSIVLKIFGAQLGYGVVIKPNVNIKYPWNLSIGNYTWIGEGVWIDNLAKVNIGSNCCISQGAYLLTGNHNYKVQSFDLMVSKINIENGAWVGAKAVVCPSVSLKEASVLTVGSIATKDLDAFGIYQGNPAIKIKERIIK